ncbi:MAG: lipase family protein [Shimia sp.]
MKEPKLNITGHSLGGGLASAAAAWLADNPSDLPIRCVTFNASGVHSATLNGAPRNAGGTIDAISTRDDPLTTLQSRPGNIPFLQSILSFAEDDRMKAGFPEALGTQHAPLAAFAGGQSLPGLLPLYRQTLVPGTEHPFALTNRLDTMLAGSNDLVDFANRLIALLNETYRDDPRWGLVIMETLSRALPNTQPLYQIYKVYEFYSIYKEMFASLMEDIGAELETLKDLAHDLNVRHAMPTVIASYDDARAGRGAGAR